MGNLSYVTVTSQCYASMAFVVRLDMDDPTSRDIVQEAPSTKTADSDPLAMVAAYV